jgi:hypothetical protein
MYLLEWAGIGVAAFIIAKIIISFFKGRNTQHAVNCVYFNTNSPIVSGARTNCQVCGKVDHFGYVILQEIADEVYEKCGLSRDGTICLNCLLQACERLGIEQKVAGGLKIGFVMFYKSIEDNTEPILPVQPPSKSSK